MPDIEMMPLREASSRLGVSVDTLRRRIRDGTLVGERRQTAQGFAWYVPAPAVPSDVQEVGNASADGSAAHVGAQVAAGDGYAAEVVQLRERVAGLERQLSATEADRDGWREHAARLIENHEQAIYALQQASAFTRALPAGDMEPNSAPPSPASTARSGWWARLRKRRVH